MRDADPRYSRREFAVDLGMSPTYAAVVRGRRWLATADDSDAKFIGDFHVTIMSE
jgi:hypothetical protein